MEWNVTQILAARQMLAQIELRNSNAETATSFLKINSDNICLAILEVRNLLSKCVQNKITYQTENDEKKNWF